MGVPGLQRAGAEAAARFRLLLQGRGVLHSNEHRRGGDGGGVGVTSTWRARGGLGFGGFASVGRLAMLLALEYM